jgi:thioesterase domain-containing protein/acyl carrier protein
MPILPMTYQIDRHIAELSPTKRALLEKKLQQKAGQLQRDNAIPKLLQRESIPLSFAQSKLWSLERLDPGNTIYNRTVKIEMTGQLDAVILEQSLNEIVKRHEVLRASFPAVGEEPRQAIAPSIILKLPLLDLSHLPEVECKSKVEELGLSEARQLFDLTQAPLLRAKLIKASADRHILLLSSHHIIFDGWSDNVFMQELAAIYPALASGSSFRLPELPIQYTDFAAWQQNWLTGKVLDSQLDYWKQQLGGNPPPLQLPTDYPRSGLQNQQGARHHLNLSLELTRSIESFCQQEKTTLFIALLAAFNLLLYQYSEQEEIIICSPVAGRNRMEIENLIGYFNNILPMRVNLSGNPSFREFIARVRQVVVGAYEHQEVPFQKIGELPNLVRTPLAIGMFAVQTAPTQFLELPGISIQSSHVHSGAANFDLSLSVEQIGDILRVAIEYRTGLFAPSSIVQMADNFPILLQNIVDCPDLVISSLPSFKRSGFGADREEPTTFTPPNSELEAQLVKIWENILEISPISTKENFFALGGHSLVAVRLFAAIEQQLNRKLPLATLFAAPTIEQLAEMLSPSEKSTLRNSLVAIKPGTSHPPLFLVHDADGETILYRNLAYALNSDRAVYGLQPYGRDGFPILHTRISDMVSHYIETIRTVQPTGPYLLGGLCVGGILAFEIALQLQARGEKVAFVGLIDAVDVQAPRKTGKIAAQRLDKWLKVLEENRHESFLKRFVQIIQAFAQKTKNFAVYELSSRSRQTQNKLKILLLRYCLDKGLPLPSLLRGLDSRSVYQFAESQYVPDGLFEGYLRLFLATEGEGIEESAIHRTDLPLLGWDKRVVEEIEIYNISGTHSSMLQEPSVRAMGASMEKEIQLALTF